MKKYLNNIMLSISLIFIFSISVYFIIQKIKSENLGHYLDLLGDKLMAVLPENKRADEVAQLYDQFKQQVDEKKLAPAKVEKLASEILNLENLEDSLRLQRVEKAMQSALNIPIPFDSEIIVMPEPPDIAGYIPHPEDEKKWRELGEHLKKVYIFEENLRKNEREKELIDRRFFRYDSNLQVIIDGRLREDLLRISNETLVKSIKELEKQKWLIWNEDHEREMKEKMQTLQDSLQTLKLHFNELKNLPQINVVVPGIDSIKIEIKLPPDSIISSPPAKSRS